MATSPSNINATTGFVNNTGAKPISPAQFSPNAQAIAQEWSTLTPNQPTSAQMHAELASTQPRTGFWPKFSSIGTRALGAVGSFVLGWQVGTEIRHALMPTNPGPSGGLPVTKLRFLDKGDCMTGSVIDPLFTTNCAPSGPFTAKRDGIIQFMNTNSGQGSRRWSPWTTSQQSAPVYSGPRSSCSNLPTSPSGVELFWAAGSPEPSGGCRNQYNNFAVMTHPPLAWYPGAGGAAETVTTAMPYPGQAGSVPAAETAVQVALDSGDYPALSAWLDHQAEPENYPDPTITQKKEDHRCDRTPGPTYMNPGGSPDPFNKHILTPFQITNRPTGFETVEVYLHDGETHWIPGRHPETDPAYLDDWGGWGWRHIRAKHGWNDTTDVAETEYALANGTPVVQLNDKFLYSMPVDAPGDGGVSCIRNVVVKFTAGSGDPRPPGIITSFNSVAP